MRKYSLRAFSDHRQKLMILMHWETYLAAVNIGQVETSAQTQPNYNFN